MTNSTQSLSESSTRTTTYNRTIKVSDAVETATNGSCPVLNIQTYLEPPPSPPKNYSKVSDLIGVWEKNPARKAEMEKARGWVADSFYPDDGVTVRNLRLNKGWSQSRLAGKISTSQPHVARIERGTENISIATCRKLANALDVDMNTLNQALLRQESIAESNRK